MTVQPRNVDELRDAVKTHSAIAIRGGGTKSAPNANSQTVTLDTRGLSSITEYSPEECVLTALAGTPISEVNARLATHGQYLPFDPLLPDAGATIGGTVAAGLSGSGRHRYGGVRDFVIGLRVVDGEGRLIRSGGKVVKNAAGFLLHHGMVGSLGRFGVITEVTVKVFPAPPARATVRVECGTVDRAWSCARLVQGFDLEAIDFDSAATLWIRIAGRTQSLGERVDRLQRAIGGVLIMGSEEERIWADARELRWIPAGYSLIKMSGPPRNLPLGAARFTCAGGVSWVAVNDVSSADADLNAALGRGLVVRGPGAGTLVGRVEPGTFEERVRRVLDPRNRFNPSIYLS